MFFSFLIGFFALISLAVLHEFGHFILSKLFGVKVEEFGIGYPPRIIGKKVGETVYSLNLLPFGAFVRLKGEIEGIEDSRSFSQQPVGKRALIALGGVVSFWIMASILLSIVFGLGAPIAIEDQDSNFINPRVQISAVADESPAKTAGLKPGDIIKKLEFGNLKVETTKVKEIQEFVNSHLGKEIILSIERENKNFEVNLVPRVSSPIGEGPTGVSLVRTAIKKYPWYQVPLEGISATGKLTLAILEGYSQAIKNLFQGLQTGVEMTGPVGVVNLLTEASQLGLTYFLNFLAVISLYLALFNILPIPAADGGKLLFLGIEAVRKKPVSPKIEQEITTAFFMMLIVLMIFVTIKDITRIF